jgi:colicin import membrane protein
MSEAAARPEADLFSIGWRDERQRDDDGNWHWVQVPLTAEDFLHPQEGDHFMINLPHGRDLRYLEDAMQVFANGRGDVLVCCDNRVEWEHGGLRPMGPDVAVFTGVTDPDTVSDGTFDVAAQHARPVLVIEITSPATRNIDLNDKVFRYHAARVPFYAIVDEQQESPREIGLLGYRWTEDGYVRVPLDARGWLWLEPVRLWLAAEGGQAVCYEENGTRVPSYREERRARRQLEARTEELQGMAEEAIGARQQAEREAERERQVRLDMEAKLRDALAEVERMKGKP